MKYISIDTGVKTGFAVWDPKAKYLSEVSTLTITKAMERIKVIYESEGKENVKLFIEDARLRKWFGNSGRERLKGAGSVCRDSSIWEGFCKENGLEYKMIAPKNNRTKLSPSQFKTITKWIGKTSEHARDAAMMIFGK